jgi:membrane protein implicated in regulation of membrane protease activity
MSVYINILADAMNVDCITTTAHQDVCVLAVAKGAAKTLGSTWGLEKNAWVSAVIAAGVSILTAAVVVPLLKRHSAKHHEEQNKKLEAGLENEP